MTAAIAALFLVVFSAVLNALASQLPGERLPSDWRGPHPHFRRQGLHAAPRGRARHILAGPATSTKEATA